MHIALDARAWNWTGVGRYIRGLAKEYAKNPRGHKFTLLVPRGQEDRIREELEGGIVIPASEPESRSTWIPDQVRDDTAFSYIGVEPSYYSVKEQTVFLQQLNNLKNIDLVHFPHFNVPVLYNRPYIVTIHDVTRFIFPGQKRQSLLQQIGYEHVFSHAVRNAKTVIAVSKTTAQDMQLLPMQARNMQVVTEGIEEKFFTEITDSQRDTLREYIKFSNQYILFVGVWMSHKNIFRLLDAFEIVSKKYSNTKLVITGKYQQGYSDLVGYVKEKKLEESVIFPGFVPDELLPALYAGAELMIFPSLYEGYGLPPLEAQACGTPVVSSNVSSMPELLKDSVEYVNPEVTQDIARGIMRVLGDFEYAKELRKLGRQNVEQYRTILTADTHIRAYENALQ